MKNVIIYILTASMGIALLNACGPSEEELRQQEEAEQQARQDSLERVWEAEMEQMQRDSIEQAREDSLALAQAEAEEEARLEAERININYDQNGPFTVQVRAWRSEDKAEEHAQMWRDRGFEHAYVEEYGDESVGDLWYRVRIGNVATRDMAMQLQDKLKNEYESESWVGNISTVF